MSSPRSWWGERQQHVNDNTDQEIGPTARPVEVRDLFLLDRTWQDRSAEPFLLKSPLKDQLQGPATTLWYIGQRSWL